jgi:serine/threonine-protein kinase
MADVRPVRTARANLQGGKEELRASLLKTYVLRLRAEKGERAVENLLEGAGVDSRSLDQETAWVSVSAARRALRALATVLGGENALRQRGEWATHPEALGTLVRMVRSASKPIDAYRYLAQNAKEVTRIGTWEIEERPTKTSVKLTYKIRDDADDDARDRDGERLLCGARWGELASIPRIWGLQEAHVTHDTCIAKGGEACIYDVRWSAAPKARMALMAGIGAAVLGGALVALVGGWTAGVLAAVLAGGLGAGFGVLWDRSLEDRRDRIFERHRIAALERGLELKGDTHTGPAGGQPGELGGSVLGGKYKILRKIGSGGIGVVYAAEHVTLGHEVAVKVLRGAAAKDGGEIARLRREAYIQANVDHPSVVRVLDLDQMADGSIYVVMERLYGRSLADKLARDFIIPPGFAIPVFIGVCRALAAAHAKGVVHRDLKPGNVFILNEPSGSIVPERIKVLDFGMSKLQTAESLTQAGYTLGTPEYMAPEQCIGAPVEARTDLYALGVLMYEALTGELPITSHSRRELLDLHQRQIPTPMRLKRPDLPIPEALDKAVMACLKKRINDRPAGAAALAEMLAAIPLEGLPTTYPNVRKPNVVRPKWTDPPPTR